MSDHDEPHENGDRSSMLDGNVVREAAPAVLVILGVAFIVIGALYLLERGLQ